MFKPFSNSFYGWKILGGAVVCQFVSISVGQMVAGIFLESITKELNIPVWQFSATLAIANVTGAFIVLIIGPLIDRLGLRNVMLTGMLFCSVGLFGLSQLSSFIHFFIFQIITSSVGWILFGPAVVNSAIIKWFVARRGFALAIGSIGVPLAAIISPVVITPIVDTYGFRTGYMVLSIFVLIIITPIALMMIRQPEDIGLLPDGVPADKQSNKTLKEIEKDNQQTYTRSQAIKTSSFWLLAIGYGLNAAALTTISLYAIPFATDIGYTRSLGAIALSISGIGNLSSKILWGWGLQRFDARRLAGVALSTSATGVLLMILSNSTQEPIFLLIGFFMYGFGFGATIPVSEFLWSRYFGRRYIASIQSVGRPVTAILAVIGPIGAGVLYDISSSYIVAFFLVACVYLLGALSINISNNPPKLHNNA